MSTVTNPPDLRAAAREIFGSALRSADAGQAVRRAVQLDGKRLTVVDTSFDLASNPNVYAIALGKAAPAMAAALDDVLGDRFAAGVISGPALQQHGGPATDSGARWQYFAGGHPLPNQQSLNAAQASFALLRRADHEHALVLFLISGGGSAMIESPIAAQITLADLREANRLLISCGASIAEINCVRRAISTIKGGRLARQAPNTRQISLIVSDTNAGDEASVASGPTIETPAEPWDARAVIANYQALANLPISILRQINESAQRGPGFRAASAPRSHYVLLDNRRALAAAAGAAHRQGFLTEIAADVVEFEIEQGCRLLLTRIEALRSQSVRDRAAVCLISGGEFLCPVRGNGVGGRNAETVLRCAIDLDQQRQSNLAGEVVVLSAGTDGIDGNSPGAGAIADNNTLRRAQAANLDAHSFLNASDAFTFFEKLGDAVVTGATGTNVRDVRILLAR